MKQIIMEKLKTALLLNLKISLRLRCRPVKKRIYIEEIIIVFFSLKLVNIVHCKSECFSNNKTNQVDKKMEVSKSFFVCSSFTTRDAIISLEEPFFLANLIKEGSSNHSLLVYILIIIWKLN